MQHAKQTTVMNAFIGFLVAVGWMSKVKRAQ